MEKKYQITYLHGALVNNPPNRVYEWLSLTYTVYDESEEKAVEKLHSVMNNLFQGLTKILVLYVREVNTDERQDTFRIS